MMIQYTSIEYNKDLKMERLWCVLSLASFKCVWWSLIMSSRDSYDPNKLFLLKRLS